MISASSIRCSTAVVLLAFGVMLGACTTRDARRPSARADRPRPLTVTQLQTMLDQGETIGVIIGKIDSSGTVYRLTPDVRNKLRSEGMPASILSRMEETYDRAVRRDPSLATSDAKWIKVDNYWYGGAPAGWPPE